MEKNCLVKHYLLQFIHQLSKILTDYITTERSTTGDSTFAIGGGSRWTVGLI